MSWVAAAIAGSAVLSAVTAPKGTSGGANTGGAGPDLAAANAAGIQTDLSTLPLRLQVSQAASGGGVYTDPSTGQTYDFRGRFDPVRFFKQNPGAFEYYNEESKATGNPPRADIEGFAKDWFGGQGLNANDAAAKLEEYNTGSASYKNQTDAFNQAQKTQAGTSLAVDTAKQQLGALQGSTPDFAAYVAAHPELKAVFDQNKKDGDARTIEQWGKDYYDTYGQAKGDTLPTTGGLAKQTNDLNLNLQNQTFDAGLAANAKSNAAGIVARNWNC